MGVICSSNVSWITFTCLKFQFKWNAVYFLFVFFLLHCIGFQVIFCFLAIISETNVLFCVNDLTSLLKKQLLLKITFKIKDDEFFLWIHWFSYDFQIIYAFNGSVGYSKSYIAMLTTLMVIHLIFCCVVLPDF